MNSRKSDFVDFDARENLSCGEYIPALDALLYACSHISPSGRKSEIFLLNRRDGQRRVISAGGTDE